MATPPAESDGTSLGQRDPASDRLRTVLADIVGTGVLTQDQADAVTAAWVTQGRFEATEVQAPSPAPTPAHATTWRGRLLESAVYLGAAFVVAAAGLVVGRQWSAMSRELQIGLVSGLTVLGLVAGVALGGPVRPRWRAPLDPVHAVRRRSASTILIATAALAASAMAVVLADARHAAVAALGVAFVVVVVALVVAPSALGEIALFGVTVALVASTLEAYLPEPGSAWDQQTWAVRQRVIAVTLLALGAGWAWGMSRLLRHRLLAVCGGLGLGLVAAAMLQVDESTTPAVLAMLAVAGATLVTYLRAPEWPWITATVIAATAMVFLLAGDTLGPAVAFLIAGLVLLGGVAVVVLLQRRHAGAGPGPHESQPMM